MDTGIIKLENYELIQEKLIKLRCTQGCQNSPNYIIYEMGLFCTTCLSKLEEVPPNQLASLENLSKVIAQLTQNYQINTKNGNNLVILRAEVQQQNAVIRSLRDSLAIDVKTINVKTNQMINAAENVCVKQSKNQPLENFFEPDFTATVVLSESDLFLDNLKNLKVVEENGQVKYVFQQPKKNPEQSVKKALKQYQASEKIIGQSHHKVKDIMARFKKSIASEAQRKKEL